MIKRIVWLFVLGGFFSALSGQAIPLSVFRNLKHFYVRRVIPSV